MERKRFFVIANPFGGTRNGERVLENVKPVFAAAGAELHIHKTQHPRHASELAAECDVANYDAICVIGGDGTVHEVVNGLLKRDSGHPIPLGIIPAGTGNTLHHELGCADPLTAARSILAGHTRAMDVARVTTNEDVFYCMNIVGWGGVADINLRAERLRWLGLARYSAAALWQIASPRQHRARLIVDDDVVEDEFLFMIACNTKTTGVAACSPA